MAKHSSDFSLQQDVILGEGSQAKFNMGLAYLQRLDILLYNINYFCLKRDYRNMKLFLDRLYAEIKSAMQPKEKEECNKLKKDTHHYYNPALQVNYNGFWDKLEDYEDFLRNMLKVHNMMMPEMADPRQAAYT